MGLTESGDYIWDIPHPESVEIAPGQDTIPRVINHRLPRFGDLRLYGTREFRPDGTRGTYEWLTYRDMARAVNELAHGLQALGLQPRQRVIIFANNRAEWPLADWAVQCCNAIVCPFYDSMAVDELVENMKTCQADAVFVSLDCLSRYAQAVEKGAPAARHVILMDDRLDDRATLIAAADAGELPRELIPRFVSTRLRSEKEMDSYFDAYTKVFNKMMDAHGDLPDQAEMARILPPLYRHEGTRSEEDCKLDGGVEAVSHYLDYAPPDYVKAREIPSLNDKTTRESVFSLVTHLFTELRELGRRLQTPEERDQTKEPRVPEPEGVTPETVCTFIFTSGSTGVPRAAQVTHIGLLYSGDALAARGAHSETDVRWPCSGGPPHDYFISYLPLAHVFARCLSVRGLQGCEHDGFWRGTVPELLEDIATLRPTFMPCVPRILQKIYGVIMDKVSKMSFPVRFLFNRQLKSRLHRFYDLGKEEETLMDRLILGSIKAQFGGRVRVTFCGSAPLSTEIGRFFQVTLCRWEIEGYASSETSSGGCVQRQGHRLMGNIGQPIGSRIECKLSPVPELGYCPADTPDFPAGELCFRGPNLFVGYYNDAEATAAVMDEDGWFHTGDIARFHLGEHARDNGAQGPYIRIVDRKKSVIKTAVGEFVATETIQTALSDAKFCGQVFVGGSSLEPYVLAVVVPDELTFAAAARKLIDRGEDVVVTRDVLKRYCADARAIEMVHRELLSQARKISLKGFEVPKAVILDPEAWTVDNGLCTPSMKLRMPLLRKHYADLFDKVYAELHARGVEGGRSFEPDFAGIAAAVSSVISSAEVSSTAVSPVQRE